MMRRARLNLKPNVRPGGRTPGQGVASSVRDGGVPPPAESVPDQAKDVQAAGPGESVTTDNPVEPQPQEANKAEPSETANNEAPPSKTTSTLLQRRKRISTLPNLAKPRVSSSASAAVVPPPKPSQVDIPSAQPISTVPNKNDGSSSEKAKVLSPQKAQVPQSPQVQHVTLPEKRTPVPQVPQFSPYKKSVLKPQEVSPAKPVESAQKEDFSPLKERPSQKSCSNELFEVVKKTTPKKIITSNLEKERLRRAQKLRDLLKNELRKERKIWRANHPIIAPIEEPERSKMRMRDFVHFIPTSNPMSSSLEESKSSEKSSPVESQVTGLGGKNSAEEDDPDDEDEEDDSQLLAPRVKVAEDGSIILDEESLTVEVSRGKAPIVEGNDPIFERGSTTTYSSFRRSNYSKPWSDKETDMFFLAISMVGTDFSMIGQLFPHRERTEIKNKFKKEERMNGWRIDKAFREKKDFDFDFFAKLLEKALEAGKNKKSRTKQPRKTSTKSRKKQKDKTAAEQSLCDEELVISEEEGVDAGTAEKENQRSPGVDECLGVPDSVPVKKKRAKKKKDNTKEPEEENNESQEDDLTQKPKKKKSGKNKTTGEDTDNRVELHSGDGDGSLKETQAKRKTRVQKNKPDYKEPELEDDENDDVDTAEDFEADDAPLSCNAGETDLFSQSVSVICEEESSLVLFTEESDDQSGINDLSSIHQSLCEVDGAVSQVSDVSLVAPKVTLGETEPMDITQEGTCPPALDTFDTTDGALHAGTGQIAEQDLEPKDKQKIPQGRRVRPAPNFSRTSLKKKVSTEEQSDATQQAAPSDDVNVGKSDKKIVHEEALSVDQQRQTDQQAEADDSSPLDNGHKESSIKPTLPGRGRLQRPKPNLPLRTSARREKRDFSDSKDVPMEGAEKCADVSDGHTQNKEEDTGKLNREDVDTSSADDQHREDRSFAVHVSSPVKMDVGSESDLSQAEESSTVHQDGDKGEISKGKPSLSVRGRFRPKPNLTRASAKNKASETEQESQPSCSGQVSHVDKPSLHSSDRDQEDEVKERVQSSGSQNECGKSSIKPAPLARGRFQRPKPNLIKASTRKEAFDNKEDSTAQSTGQTEVDLDKDDQSDITSGQEVNEVLVHTESGSSQKSCKSEINLHPLPSLQVTQDSTGDQDDLTDASAVSETQSIKSPIRSAPLVRGRFQKPKPNLVRASGCKVESEKKKNESLEAASDAVGKTVSTELTKEVPPVEEPCLETPESMMTVKEDSKKLTESQAKPPILLKGRFQRPKPNLGRAASKRDVPTLPNEPKNAPKGEACAESTVESKDTPSVVKDSLNDPNIPLDGQVFSTADAEMTSSTVKDQPEKNFFEALAKPEEAKNDAEQGEAPPLRRARTRFPKPSPNLGRAAVRKEPTEPKTLVPEKGQETSKVVDMNSEPLKNEDLPNMTIADHGNKEAGDAIEEKSAGIKPVQLKRGRLIRPVPNLGKLSSKTMSPSQSKTKEDLNSAAMLEDNGPVVVTSPSNKRKASSSNVESSTKRTCRSSTPQRPSCLSDSEVDQASLTDDPQSSSQCISDTDTSTPLRSRFGRTLRRLSSLPSVSPKSETSSDRPEKEKATRSVKSNTTKVTKPGSSKSKGKTTLVKIRATQQEEDEEEDVDLGFEEEDYDLAPDMQNQAPVFVPFSLRSPRPVTAEIEETVEELEIPVDIVDSPTITGQDLESRPFHHVAVSQAQPDKTEQCDGSAEAAMTLISMGSSVYNPNIDHHITGPGRQNKPEELTSLANAPSSPHYGVCVTESGVTMDSGTVKTNTQTDGVSSDSGSAENLPNAINSGSALPIEQMSYPVVQENAMPQDFSSQDTSVSDCFLGEHDTGEEATFILTLVEIPINDDYVYSCDPPPADSLPAPVLISSGSSQALAQKRSPSVEEETYEPRIGDSNDKDLKSGETSKKRSAEGIDGGDPGPVQKKPLICEQVVDLEIKAPAADGDGKAEPDVSITEPKPKKPAGVSQVIVSAVRERSTIWPTANSSSTVPVEMPGMSTTDPLSRNLPQMCANLVTTSKTALKRPGKKPLGFLPLVCKGKQPKKAKEETRKKRNLPILKGRNNPRKVRGQQRESPDLNLENANDSEVPSPADMENTTEETLPSTSQMSDNPELETPSKSLGLATEEEAAPVSEYFFSDIFMEVDD